MKFLLYLYFIVLLPAFSYADAGFNIGRPKAPCYAVFKGIDKLNDYEFFKSGKDYKNDYGIVKNNDTISIYYSEGEKWWHGPIKIIVQDKRTQQNIDSFTLTAEGYNLTVNFTGVENNKVKYSIDKSKAEYPYLFFPGENVNNASVAKRNKFILISLSAIGFLALAFMFYKRRGANIS